jgi:hypothetical protein
MNDEIARLLADENMSDDTALRDGLTHLQRSFTSVRPLPSPELAALLTGRQRSAASRHRGLIAALAVVAVVGGTATAAAANPQVRSVARQVVTTVIGTVVPGLANPPGHAPINDSKKPQDTPGHSAAPTRPAAPSDRPNPTDHPGNGADNGADNGNEKSGNGSGHAPNPGTGHSTAAPSAPSSSHKP